MNIKRKDYETKSLLKIIDFQNFNDNLHWLSYKVFNKNLKQIIGIDIKDESELNNIINNIKDINFISYDNNF